MVWPETELNGACQGLWPWYKSHTHPPLVRFIFPGFFSSLGSRYIPCLGTPSHDFRQNRSREQSISARAVMRPPRYGRRPSRPPLAVVLIVVADIEADPRGGHPRKTGAAQGIGARLSYQHALRVVNAAHSLYRRSSMVRHPSARSR